VILTSKAVIKFQTSFTFLPRHSSFH